jgi:endonuclease/exonuclease/phosphatase family metal-dependent hydrolase
MQMSISEKHLLFSVMSLNLRFGLAEDGPNNWSNRRDAYKPLLEAFPSDFFAFQEANDFQVDFLAHLLPEHAHIGQRNPAPERWQSNVIFFHERWRCLHHEHFYLSSTPHTPSRFADSRWPRQCTLGVFQHRNHKLAVVNTHFDFASAVQVRSARLIREQIGRHAPVNPVILMGDFNATPESACYRVLTKDENGHVALRNAFTPPYAGTFHGFEGTQNEGAPIDWILYRGPLQVHEAKVVTEKFADVYPSDHYPLVAGFSIIQDFVDA